MKAHHILGMVVDSQDVAVNKIIFITSGGRREEFPGNTRHQKLSGFLQDAMGT
jgi:hypothetical protein